MLKILNLWLTFNYFLFPIVFVLFFWIDNEKVNFCVWAILVLCIFKIKCKTNFFYISIEPPPPPLSVHVEIVGPNSLLVHYFPPIRLQNKKNIITKYKSKFEIFINIVIYYCFSLNLYTHSRVERQCLWDPLWLGGDYKPCRKTRVYHRLPWNWTMLQCSHCQWKLQRFQWILLPTDEPVNS